MSLRVVLAEDAGLLRHALVRVLESSGLEVVAAVGDLESLLAAVEQHDPDVVVTDLRMPPTSSDEGLRAAQRLRATAPAVGVVLFSAHVEPAYAERLLEGGGGRAYLLKDRVADLDAFVDAVQTVHRGGVVVDPEVVEALMRRRRSHDVLARLTPREREVLGLMATGLSNSALCSRLALSAKTVDRHIGQIFAKFELEPGDEHRRVRAVLTWLNARR